MYDRPKGNFSFLVALSKQLSDAVQSHRDDDVGNYSESLAHSLALLLAHVGYDVGELAEGDDDGVDSDDADGDGPELGSPGESTDAPGDSPALALTSGRARRLVPASAANRGGLVGSRGLKRPASLLKKGGKRRGKK